MTIITDAPELITAAYQVAYRYGLDILDAGDNIIVSHDFDTEAERDGYRTFITDRPEYRPAGAVALECWERVMTYQPIPRYQHGVRNKRAKRLVYEWMWA